jgi:hypothetical protein
MSALSAQQVHASKNDLLPLTDNADCKTLCSAALFNGWPEPRTQEEARPAPTVSRNPIRINAALFLIQCTYDP